MEEEWKDIITHKGLYQISNLGRIRNNKRQILKQELLENGYLRTHLSKNGKVKWYLVHRLVAEAFIDDNPSGLPYVNHKNEIKTDNRITNLEWCTQDYNVNYGTRNKRISKSKQNDIKLSKKVKCIETNITYPSAMEAQRQTGIYATSIIRVCKGKGKLAGGYHWEYRKEE